MVALFRQTTAGLAIAEVGATGTGKTVTVTDTQLEVQTGLS
jgi:Cdc6-like AAA superfamily ATPase